MKKQITYLSIFLISLTTLQGQVEQQSLPTSEEISNRRTSFNLDEIKVRWKKAALENCPGVPCVTTTVPGPPTSVVATAGNATASVAFVAPANNGGSVITGYTVTSSPGGIIATGTSSPINVTGLTNGTAYTFAVIATNAVGNSVASSASTAVTPVAPVCPTSTVTDVDNNIYNTVAIGTQCWTKENLKVTKYTDGTAIPLDATGGSGGPSSTWQNSTTGAYAIYANEASSGTNATNYGYLYNWYAAKGITAGSTTYKNICPTGYHVPTDLEWSTLVIYLDATALATTTGVQSSTAGTLMKSTSTLWNAATPASPGTNTSGFTALPGGALFIDGSFFYDIRSSAFFWSATENGSNAWFRQLYNYNGSVNRSNIFDKTFGASVRCLRD